MSIAPDFNLLESYLMDEDISVRSVAWKSAHAITASLPKFAESRGVNLFFSQYPERTSRVIQSFFVKMIIPQQRLYNYELILKTCQLLMSKLHTLEDIKFLGSILTPMKCVNEQMFGLFELFKLNFARIRVRLTEH